MQRCNYNYLTAVIGDGKSFNRLAIEMCFRYNVNRSNFLRLKSSNTVTSPFRYHIRRSLTALYGDLHKKDSRNTCKKLLSVAVKTRF